MLECRACLLRCLRAICSDVSPVSLSRSFRGSLQASTSSARIYSRHASSLSTRRKQDASKPNSIIRAVASQKAEDGALADDLSGSQMRRLKLEVPWLGGDRLKVLNRTKELLKENRHAEALELVKLASKGVQCTIAWNAVLDDLMKRKKVNEAFKIYNDMKKRAQIPDSYTYSTLLNGLTANSKSPNVGRRAAQLWQSLKAPNSPVKPSILLTNAALKACASANDIDAVWSIAGAIPDAGAEAADSITYTTIINAMRFSTAIGRGEPASEAQVMALNTAIAQSRQIWNDVISRWTTAKLTLDEDLVCAMGMLLFESRQPQDWDSVFALCLQTMNIPRASPPLEVRDRSYNPNKVNQLPAPYLQTERTETTPAQDITPTTGQEFNAVPKLKKGVWVKPTNQTLTLLMETCQKMFLPKAAMQYWKTLTQYDTGFFVEPDSPSFHAYLRMLRQSKSSSEAVRFIRDEMKDEPGLAKTFRIAMSTCVKNQMSPNAMREATELMDIMVQRMRYIDPKAGTMFMKLALSSPHVQDTLVAVNYMTPQNTKLWETLKSSSPQRQEEFVELGKHVVSGFDRVMTAKKSSKEVGFEKTLEMKAAWTYAIQRLLNGGKKTAPIRSDEERVLLEKKKALHRFERKKERDGVRTMRSKSRVVTTMPRRDRDLPVLESDSW